MDNSQSSGQKQNQQQQPQQKPIQQHQPQLNLNQKPVQKFQQTNTPSQPIKPTANKNVSAAPTPSPAMQVAAAFVVGILVGVIGYSLVNKNPNVNTALNTQSASSTISLQNSNQISPTSADEIVNPTSVSDNSVIVHSQPAGASVALSQVDLKNGGWVAIQENAAGTPGVILGAAYFDAGQTLNGTVSLLRPTVAGTSYFAVIHTDDGTKPRVFNYHTDTILNDSAGNPIDASFTAQ